MAKRGRKPLVDPPVLVAVHLPQSLNAQVELLLYDPVLQKPTYGARSKLIERLLRDWLERVQSGAESPPAPNVDS